MGRAFITHSSTGGIPIGGITGQVLTKRTDNSFDMEWTTLNAETLQDAENILFYCGTNSSGDYIFGTYDKWLEAGSPQPPSTTMVIPKAGGLTTVYVNNTPIAGINLDNALILLNEYTGYIEVDTLANVINQLVVVPTKFFTCNEETYEYPEGSTWETWIENRDDNLFTNDSGTVNINMAAEPTTTEDWKVLRDADGEPIATTSIIQETTYYTDDDFYTLTLDANGGTIDKTEYRLLKTGDTTLSLPTPTPPEGEDVEFLGWVGTGTGLGLTGSSQDTDTSVSVYADRAIVTSNTGSGSFSLIPHFNANVMLFAFDTDAGSLTDLSLSLQNWYQGTIGEKIYSSGSLFKGYMCACKWTDDMSEAIFQFSITPAATSDFTYARINVTNHKALFGSIEVTQEKQLMACWGRPLQKIDNTPPTLLSGDQVNKKLKDLAGGGENAAGSSFNSMKINKIVFQASSDPIPANALTTSLDAASKIIAYRTDSDTTSGTIYIRNTVPTAKIVFPSDCSNMFRGSRLSSNPFITIETIDFGTNLIDTSNVTTCYRCFQYCGSKNATSFKLDLREWDLSNCTNMEWMFRDTGQSSIPWRIITPHNIPSTCSFENIILNNFTVTDITTYETTSDGLPAPLILDNRGSNFYVLNNGAPRVLNYNYALEPGSIRIDDMDYPWPDVSFDWFIFANNSGPDGFNEFECASYDSAVTYNGKLLKDSDGNNCYGYMYPINNEQYTTK